MKTPICITPGLAITLVATVHINAATAEQIASEILHGPLATVDDLSSETRRKPLSKNSRHDLPGAPSLDGSAYKNHAPLQGAANTPYRRLSEAAYADGIGEMIEGPELRHISNRVFADGAQNLFSETGVTQWAYNWGQFLDHSIGLRETGTEQIEVKFDSADPLEHFNNGESNLLMFRSAIAPGSGETQGREHLNTVSSYIDAWAVYGGSESRLEWLREGPVDGDLSNNSARLMLTEDGHLPTVSARGDVQAAPVMEIVGQLHVLPDADQHVIVAGDKRANENIALTAVQTLFAREHNRVVGLLPDDLSEQEKFDIARQMVIATQQYITYNEFLPAVGLHLSRAERYRPEVDVSVSQEFAVVGYRAHSMIHGEIEMAVPADHYSEELIASFAAQGIEMDVQDDLLELAVPLNVAFANPQLAAAIGIGPIAAGLGSEPQYKNDEQIDNQLRSVLFQLPDPDIENPDACLDGDTLPECFRLANDLGSLDIFRARDHGIATYNDLREAYDLPRIRSFSALTGEVTEEFPLDDPTIDVSDAINDPDILEFVELRDSEGQLLELSSEEAESSAVVGVRRTTLAARLKAIYGKLDSVDAFVGMISEPHAIGSEFGELQHAIWKVQFEALRDGDPRFYLWNRSLRDISREYRSQGLDYRQSLADVIINNTDIRADQIQRNIFLVSEE